MREDRGPCPGPALDPELVGGVLAVIKQTYTAGLLDELREFRPGSLLILDEAHHAAPASGRKYAIDSQITKAIRELAPKFEHRLFLTATLRAIRRCTVHDNLLTSRRRSPTRP